MNIKLRRFTKFDDYRYYEMSQEMGPGENGFHNSLYGLTPKQFRLALSQSEKMSRGLALAPNFVPQTSYWLLSNDQPVGLGKLRHYLNESLAERGGHIGYAIRPSERNKGYGTIILKLLLEEACNRALQEVLLTVDETNMASRRVVEANHGRLTSIQNGICKYWIPIVPS